MDLGKIMIGIALVMLSIGMLVSPSGATTCDNSCTVGCGSTFSSADATVTPYSPIERDTPAGYLALVCGYSNHRSTQ
jgi:uncharacterized membrane protein